MLYFIISFVDFDFSFLFFSKIKNIKKTEMSVALIDTKPQNTDERRIQNTHGINKI